MEENNCYENSHKIETCRTDEQMGFILSDQHSVYGTSRTRVMAYVKTIPSAIIAKKNCVMSSLTCRKQRIIHRRSYHRLHHAVTPQNKSNSVEQYELNNELLFAHDNKSNYDLLSSNSSNEDSYYSCESDFEDTNSADKSRIVFFNKWHDDSIITDSKPKVLLEKRKRNSIDIVGVNKPSLDDLEILNMSRYKRTPHFSLERERKYRSWLMNINTMSSDEPDYINNQIAILNTFDSKLYNNILENRKDKNLSLELKYLQC